MSHILKIIIIVYKINFELIDRYFAEEHPQGQEIAFDKESDQLLEDDYRYIIGMGNIHVLWYHRLSFTVVSFLRFKAYGP